MTFRQPQRRSHTKQSTLRGDAAPWCSAAAWWYDARGAVEAWPNRMRNQLTRGEKRRVMFVENKNGKFTVTRSAANDPGQSVE